MSVTMALGGHADEHHALTCLTHEQASESNKPVFRGQGDVPERSGHRVAWRTLP